MPRLIERLLIVLAAVAIWVGVIALLSGGLLGGRDAPGVTGPGTGPGIRYHDQGDALLRPGEPRPAYDSDPPTSGPHLTAPVTADRATLSDDQLLQALAAGNVVLLYGSERPPAGLRALADSLAPPFTAALAQSGAAVILARRPGTTGIIALAWAHLLHVGTASDPALRRFAAYWLGRGTAQA